MPRHRQNFPDGDGNLRFFPPGGGGGGGFDPLTLITGGGGFWRADMGVTGSPNVTAWADQSSFANNLTLLGSPIANTSPTFSSTGFNSAKSGITVSDNSSTKGMGLSFTYGPATASVFALIQYGSGNGAAYGRFIWFIANGQTLDFNSTQCFEIDQGSSPGTLELSTGTTLTDGSLTGSGLYLIGIVLDGTNRAIWLNGASNNSGALPNLPGSNAGVSTFGFGASPSNNSGGATFAFLGMTQKVMDSTDWGNLKTWSNTNWGTSF